MTGEVSRLDDCDVFNLQQWNDAWNETYKFKLRTFYRFSPQYEPFWESLWRKYDELEGVQLASSVPRFRSRLEDATTNSLETRPRSHLCINRRVWTHVASWRSESRLA